MENSLITRHPSLFAGKDAPTLGVPEGWVPLVDTLFGQIEDALSEELLGQFFITGVEEKYGTLHVSCMGVYDDKVEALIDAAEVESEKTCQECSDPGYIRYGGWLRCLCDFCEKERLIRATRNTMLRRR